MLRKRIHTRPKILTTAARLLKYVHLLLSCVKPRTSKEKGGGGGQLDPP